MKMKTFVVALSVAMTALSIHGTASATHPAAGGTGAVSVGSTVAGNFGVGSNGTSTSFAHNRESATASVTASTSRTPNYSTVKAGISGATTTASQGTAYNVSTGAGWGSALSAGSARTAVQGAASIGGVSTGFNGGAAGTNTSNIIYAGTNQGSYVAGQTMSGFDAQLHYTRSSSTTHAPHGTIGGARTSSVGVTATTTGYASGANASGALAGMNAAGIANIGATGYFFASAGLSGTTSATAP